MKPIENLVDNLAEFLLGDLALGESRLNPCQNGKSDE